jgi:hypothetical protein
MFGLAWLAFVETVHRLRRHPVGQILGRIDRGSRYVLMVVLVSVAFGLVSDTWSMPFWLRWKLAAFAGVMACGVGIRFALTEHFRTWVRMAESGVTSEYNAIIERTYVKATSVLVLLWVFISIATILSITKPA